MSLILLALLAQVVAVAIGAVVFAYCIRNSAVFEFLVRGIGTFAFYRCFETHSEKSVEEKLARRQLELEGWFRFCDGSRRQLIEALQNGRGQSIIDMARQTLAGDELRLAKTQRAFDYIIAVAYLAGFGKVARKFAK